MAIDTSMYSMLQAPDIVGGYQRGLKMGDLARKRREEGDIKDAFRANTGEDGALNRQSVLSDLRKINPEKAFAYENQFSQMDQSKRKAELDNLKYQTEASNKLLWSIPTGQDVPLAQKQQAYTMARNQAIEMGLPRANEFPETYPGDGFIEMNQMQSLSAKERMDAQLKERELDLKERALINKNSAASNKKKELSTTQAKQKGLYELGVEAEKQYRESVSTPGDYDPAQSFQIIDNSEWAPNWMKNDKAIQAQAAQANWVEAFLRDASGAAIPPSERMAYARDFFPAPGDTKEVVENKRKLRERKMENARIGAGGDSTTPRREIDREAIAQARWKRIRELRAKLNRQASNK